MKTKRKKYRGGMRPQTPSSRSISRGRGSSRGRARSRGRGRSRSISRGPRQQNPLKPIDSADFQHVDEVAMNVFRNTRDIKRIMVDLNRIKEILKIQPYFHNPNVNIQEVNG